MALEIKSGTTPTVEFSPSSVTGALSSVSAAVYSPEGVLLDTISGSVDSTSLTVSAIANNTELTCSSSVAGIVAGREYLMALRSGVEVVTFERASSNDSKVYLSTRPSDTVRAGDTITGLRCTVALSSACTATRGANYRIEWTITQSSGAVRYEQQLYHVVAMPLGAIVTLAMVSELMQGYSLQNLDRFGPGLLRKVAQAAEARVRREIERVQRWPHLYGDAKQFEGAAVQAIRLELATRWNLTPPGAAEVNPQWERQTEGTFRREFDAAIERLGWYDRDDSRDVSASEAQGLLVSRIAL